MLVTAPGILGPMSAEESRSRSHSIERTNASEGEGASSENADCPSLSYHKNIAELTRLFFSGGSSAPRRRPEPSIYASKDFSSTATGRNVEEDRSLTEHAYISSSSSSSRLVGRRGIRKGTLRKSIVNPTGVTAAQNIFDELHSMCCQSSFPPTSKSGGADTHQLEPSDFAEFGRTAGPRSVEKFLACEFEMPSRTFIAFLRVRLSVHLAALVQQLVDELSAASGVLGGTQIADTCGGLLGEGESEGEGDTHNRGNNAPMDLGSVHDSGYVDRILSGTSGIFGDSPEVNGILDLLRAGARVRVVDRNTLGGTTSLSLSLSRYNTEGLKAWTLCFVLFCIPIYMST